MKIQMRFQKILMLVTLILAALSFVFGLAFLTGSLGDARYYYPMSGDIRVDYINVKNFYNVSQSFVGALVVMSIVFIILSALLFLTQTNKRRNYYISNYVIIGVVALFGFVIVIFALVGISRSMNLYYNDIDWAAYERGLYTGEGAQIGGTDFTINKTNYPLGKSPLNFVLGYLLYIVLLVDVVALVLNLVWKIKLMKGEKELLANGLSREVA